MEEFTSRYPAPTKLTTRRCLPNCRERQRSGARDRSGGRSFIRQPRYSRTDWARTVQGGMQACRFTWGRTGSGVQPSAGRDHRGRLTDDKGIIWPKASRRSRSIVNLKQATISGGCGVVTALLPACRPWGWIPLYGTTPKKRAGVSLRRMDLIGLPWAGFTLAAGV